MTPREELVQRLEAERYGPVVHEPAAIPHIPLAAYYPELLDEVLGRRPKSTTHLTLAEEGAAVQAWRERQAKRARRDRERRAEKKRLRAMTEAEIGHAV